MYQALHALAPSSGGTTLADGIAVKNPGELTRRSSTTGRRDHAGRRSEHRGAVQLWSSEQKLVAEGAGAAGVAALLNPEPLRKGRKGRR